MADYTTVQQVRATIGSIVSNTADNVIDRLITAVSRQIDRKCNRPDGFVAASTATERFYAGSGTPVLYIDEAAAITAVAGKSSPSDADYTAWAATDWIAFSGSAERPNYNRAPYNGLMTLPGGNYAWWASGGAPYRSGFRPHIDDVMTSSRGLPTVRVTAKWGYALIVPPDIENATIIAVARLFKRGEGGFSDLLASGDFGALAVRAASAPEVDEILREGRYIRPMV